MARVRAVAPKGQKIGLIACLVLGIVMLLIGCAATILIKVNEKRCTESVDGVVTELSEEKSKRGRSAVEITRYAPVFEYTYNGEEYREKSSFSSYFRPFAVGETVEIRVDPDDPSNFYVPEYKAPVRQGLMIVGAGLLFAALGALGLRTVKRRSQD